MEFVVDGSEDILAEYLTAEGIHNDLVTKIHDNRVTCSLFLDLSEEDLKDLASVIGDRIALHRTLEKARKVIEVSIAGCLRQHDFCALLYSVKNSQCHIMNLSHA